MEYIVLEGILDYYNDVMDDDYLGFVDIDEIVQIVDVVLVRSGSVMSVIDWDVVDDFIVDVK